MSKTTNEPVTPPTGPEQEPPNSAPGEETTTLEVDISAAESVKFRKRKSLASTSTDSNLPTSEPRQAKKRGRPKKIATTSLEISSLKRKASDVENTPKKRRKASSSEPVNEATPTIMIGLEETESIPLKKKKGRPRKEPSNPSKDGRTNASKDLNNCDTNSKAYAHDKTTKNMSMYIKTHAGKVLTEEKSVNSVLSATVETAVEVLQSEDSIVVSQDVSASSSSDVIANEYQMENVHPNFKDSAIRKVPPEPYAASVENVKQHVEVEAIASPEVIPEPDTTRTDEAHVVEDEGGSGGEGEAGFWVQCCKETCGKWRFLTSFGQDINQETDYWECSMNQVNYLLRLFNELCS